MSSAPENTPARLRPVPRPAPDYGDRAYWNGTIKMSLSKFFVLCVLHRGAMHGYEIAKAVEQTTGGCCSPSEGTIYPMLKEFEAGGYLSATSETVQGRQRKVYALTDKGREAFQVAVSAWLEITDCIVNSKAVLGTAAQRRGVKGGCC